jgi:hypothetical protein
MSAIASEATIRIAYDGDALENGTMDVRDLAPALIALADLFDEANKVLSGPDRAVHLRVHHHVRHGSFDVTIQIVQTWVAKILTLFAADGASGAANLIEILGFTKGVAESVGLLGLIRWLRGRPVKRIEAIDEHNVRIVVEDGDIVIRRPVGEVFRDLGVRRALAASMAPLSRDGIDSFEVKTVSGTRVEKIDRKDLPSFEPPAPTVTPAEEVNVSNFTHAYTLASVTFKEGNKWRVYDGQSTVPVTIEDAGFLDRVNRHEVSFVKDDVLRCKVRQEQTITGDALKIETFITEVLEHKHLPRQVIIPIVETSQPPVQRAPSQKSAPVAPRKPTGKRRPRK